MSQAAIPLNDPPRMPPPGLLPPMPDGGPPGAPPSEVAVQSAITSVTSNQPPEIEAVTTIVTLPGGLVTTDGRLLNKAVVRELTGYDEEALSRLDMTKNVAVFVTELLMRGVIDIGGEKPTKDLLRTLLIGDRDALVLGVRTATYGDEVEFTIHCNTCDTDSNVIVKLSEDVKVKMLEDPMTRIFDIDLRKGRGRITLLDGAAQERFSENIGVKTRPEIDTILLAKSLIELNGVQLFGDVEIIRRLSGADRAKLTDFIVERQCGPEMSDIPVPCATCGREHPISLGLPSLFRL